MNTITAEAYFAAHAAEVQIAYVDPLCAVREVKKGDKIVAGEIAFRANEDGYLLKSISGNASAFLTKAEFASKAVPEMHTVGDKQTKITFYRSKDIDPKDETLAIILKEDTTFAFKAGAYEAKAGDVLYVNPMDQDGYTVVEASAAKYVLKILPPMAVESCRLRPNLSGNKPGGAKPS